MRRLRSLRQQSKERGVVRAGKGELQLARAINHRARSGAVHREGGEAPRVEARIYVAG